MKEHNLTLLYWKINMKLYNILSAIAICVCGQSAFAQTCYVGDSIAHGYKQHNKGYGVTKVGANQRTVMNYVSLMKNECDKIYLSSGISNNPTDTQIVDQQLKVLFDAKKEVILFGSSKEFPKYGNQLNNNLSSLCSKYSNCTFRGGFTPSKDKVHPVNYK